MVVFYYTICPVTTANTHRMIGELSGIYNRWQIYFVFLI